MYKNQSIIQISNLVFRKIPEAPGIYIFYTKDKRELYVGKAKNLRVRIRSYFSQILLAKTAKLMLEAKYISFIKVTSELEALLLEAKLVKKFNPFYNSALKDDKHPLYIKITNEVYPRVITARSGDIRNSLKLYGPFPNSNSVYSVLKMLRSIFPYSQHKLGKRPCLYKQLGLCNPCPNEINITLDKDLKNYQKRLYLKNIRSIANILDGKFGYVKRNLIFEMNKLSLNNEFESAIKVREKIERLEYITQPISNIDSYLENPNLDEDIHLMELSELKRTLSKYIEIPKLKRIECYDVAHLSGANPAASMVTFIKGAPAKDLYRHFKIYQKKSRSDTDSLFEVAKRRIKYLKTWGKPDLIIVDGGRAQVSTFLKIFVSTKIPIIGLAKSEEKLVIKVDSEYFETKPQGSALHLVQRIRDEAHRFARAYHHNLVTKTLLVYNE